ncbi:MAG: sigma 54-interacting transcriptional regulator [Desulfobacteraceae bacterium]
MITVNCGAIPGSLLESELFGHETGSLLKGESAPDRVRGKRKGSGKRRIRKSFMRSSLMGGELPFKRSDKEYATSVVFHPALFAPCSPTHLGSGAS